MKKTKIKGIIMQILSCLITVALCLGAWAVGLITGDGYELPWIVCFCVIAAVMLGWLLFNIVSGIILNRNFRNMKAREMYNFTENRKKLTEGNPEAVKKSIYKLTALFYAGAVAVILVCVFASFCIGRITSMNYGEDGFAPALTFLILIIFYCWGSVDIFTCVAEENSVEDEADGIRLIKSKFPVLYALAAEARVKTGVKQPVALYAAPSGISVVDTGGKIAVLLSALDTAVLTDKEIYNVFLHEMAHVINKDSEFARRYFAVLRRAESNFGNVLVSLGKFTFNFVLTRLIIVGETYRIFTSKEKEARADEAVRNLGDPQTYVNALAKSDMIVRFLGTPCPEIEYYIYESEECPKDYYAREYAAFNKYREMYGDKWKEQMKRELSPRVPTHPIFRERAEIMGCSVYDADTRTENESYAEEQSKLLKLTGEKFFTENSPRYKQLRQVNYLNKKEAMEQYEKILEIGETPSVETSLKAMEAYFITDADKSLEIAETVLKSFPDSARANFFKGMVLYFRDDENCIACLRKAMKNGADYDSCMDAIGTFALRSGKQELIENYRETAPEVIQEVMDSEKTSAFGKKYKLVRADLAEEEISGIVNEISDFSGGKLNGVWIAMYTDSDGNRHYPLYYELKKADGNQAAETIQKVFELCALRSYKYDLRLWIFNPAEIRLIKKTEGSHIYPRKKN